MKLWKLRKILKELSENLENMLEAVPVLLKGFLRLAKKLIRTILNCK